MTRHETVDAGPNAANPATLRPARTSRGTALTLVRILLGGLFVWSGVSKLLDPLFFAFALKAFHLGLSDAAVSRLAFIIPWLEALAGAVLALGFWTRASAVMVLALLLGFSTGIISLLVRGMDVRCPCFGATELVCEGPLGVCHLIRNAILIALAIFVATRPRR